MNSVVFYPSNWIGVVYYTAFVHGISCFRFCRNWIVKFHNTWRATRCEWCRDSRIRSNWCDNIAAGWILMRFSPCILSLFDLMKASNMYVWRQYLPKNASFLSNFWFLYIAIALVAVVLDFFCYFPLVINEKKGRQNEDQTDYSCETEIFSRIFCCSFWPWTSFCRPALHYLSAKGGLPKFPVKSIKFVLNWDL